MKACTGRVYALADSEAPPPMDRITVWLAAALASLILGCASAPSLEHRTTTFALVDTDDTRLGRAIAPHAAANPGKTGIHPLPEPREAFTARVLLAAADRSLDVQYYIWHGDETGYVLFEALWQAAERSIGCSRGSAGAPSRLFDSRPRAQKSDPRTARCPRNAGSRQVESGSYCSMSSVGTMINATMISGSL
jgi:phosphatidylserine/phosphatidylglycerophosphate/cardiolipin synthase-like enzyme